MAAVSVLFGLSLFILPVLLWQLPLGRFVFRNKLLVWMAVETVLLFALLATGQWYGGGPGCGGPAAENWPQIRTC